MEIKDAKIDFLGHSGFLIVTGNGKRIAIDPYNVSDKLGSVDYILITHSHNDHCSIKDIQKLSRPGTIVIISPDAQSKITKVENVEMQVVEVGDEITLGSIKIEVLPSYNLEKDYHPKSESWHGYLIKMQGLIIYHAGDSDFIPEMRNISGYKGNKENFLIALLPVSGEYVMSADDAAKAASFISPNLAIPMHYGAGVAGSIDDAKNFVELCKEYNIEAKILDKI